MNAATFDILLDDDTMRAALVADANLGLGSTPKDLPPKWFYDDLGSQLFDEITRLEEYYPTRRERAILIERAADITGATQATTVIELGSGTSEKTRILLDAFRDAKLLQRFVPFDVSEQTLRDAAVAIQRDYPGTEVHAVVGDFELHLGSLPKGGRRLIAFLGGTIGNFQPIARAQFLRDLAETMTPGDHLLLGTDLVKDPTRLVNAYDDAAGVTAAFNKNVLTVLNRELDADFNLDDFDHVACWDTENEWIEMRLRARHDLEIKVRALDSIARFTAGEEMRTEISAKFRQARVASELAAAGLRLKHWWTDPNGDFALSLAEVATG